MEIEDNQKWLDELTKKMNDDFNETIHEVLHNNHDLTVGEKVDKIVFNLEELGYANLDKKQLIEIVESNQVEDDK